MRGRSCAIEWVFTKANQTIPSRSLESMADPGQARALMPTLPTKDCIRCGDVNAKVVTPAGRVHGYCLSREERRERAAQLRAERNREEAA